MTEEAKPTSTLGNWSGFSTASHKMFSSSFSWVSLMLRFIIFVVVQLVSHVWLCNLMACSPSGSSVPEIFQARILEWVIISFSRGSSQPRDWTLSFLHWQVASLPLSHKGSLVYYCLVQTKESLKQCWRRDETECKNPWIRSCSRRVLTTSYVSHESLEGCTCWNLPRLGHQLVTPSTVCNHACWCSVINLYFSLICLCRFFPVGERVCCRAVSPMHSPKVF